MPPTNSATTLWVGTTFGSKGTVINQLRLGYSRYATHAFTRERNCREQCLGVPNGNIGAYSDTSGVAQVNFRLDGYWRPRLGAARIGQTFQHLQINDVCACAWPP
jgi:hypothetical protein